MILHDHSAARERAARLLRKIQDRLKEELKLQSQPFASALLEDPDAFREALASSDDADIVIVAMDGSVPFPASFECWLRLYARRKKATNSALVALLERSGNSGASLSAGLKFLQDTIQTTRLDFFAQELSSSAGPKQERSASDSKGKFDEITPYPTWGINE